MGVPNTDTFSLQDVVNEIGGGVNSLQACFVNAISGGFDPIYGGNRTSLLNFRNYQHSLMIPLLTVNTVDLGSEFAVDITLRLPEFTTESSDFVLSQTLGGVTTNINLNIPPGNISTSTGFISYNKLQSSRTVVYQIVSAPAGYEIGVSVSQVIPSL